MRLEEFSVDCITSIVGKGTQRERQDAPETPSFDRFSPRMADDGCARASSRYSGLGRAWRHASANPSRDPRRGHPGAESFQLLALPGMVRNRVTQLLVAALAGLQVPFTCSETHELGEELVASYLYQVHLYSWLESNDYGRYLTDNDV